MLQTATTTRARPITVTLFERADTLRQQQRWCRFAQTQDKSQQPLDPRWLWALSRGLHHRPYMIEATCDNRTVGILPLALVKSALFGRFLVSLPYINSAGVLAENEEAATALITRAVQLADTLDVRYLELRHQREYNHTALAHQLTSKVHMRLALPTTADALWKALKPKVRNQIRKGQQHELTVHWGGEELLNDFYNVFCRNMRDLGTPVFGRDLFRSILETFRNDAELCCLKLAGRPVAAALLIHTGDTTEVPSASSLRRFNHTNANMLMYWHLLQRAIERGSEVFDFGRSSAESGTYRFKKQWGAQPTPAVWQYYLRKGRMNDMRRENSKYDRFVSVWQRLPVSLTRAIGPKIVRGIP